MGWRSCLQKTQCKMGSTALGFAGHVLQRPGAGLVAHGSFLRAITASRPRDEAQLGQIKGMGPKRLAQYGAAMLRIVAGGQKGVWSTKDAKSTKSTKGFRVFRAISWVSCSRRLSTDSVPAGVGEPSRGRVMQPGLWNRFVQVRLDSRGILW
jgi:hypothetical protein